MLAFSHALSLTALPKHFKHLNNSAIEGFHSGDKPPYWFTETKDDFYVKIDFNSKRISLVPIHRFSNVGTRGNSLGRVHERGWWGSASNKIKALFSFEADPYQPRFHVLDPSYFRAFREKEIDVYGRHFFVLKHQYGRCDVMWRSIHARSNAQVQFLQRSARGSAEKS